MVDTPGYCMNVKTCRIAASGAPVRVALEDPFICPQCGGSLAPPALDSIRPRGRMALIAALFVCVAIGAGATVLARGGVFGRPAPEPAPVLTALAPASLPGPATTATIDVLDAVPPVTADAEDQPASSHAPRKALPRGAPISREASAGAKPGRHHVNVHIAVSTPLVAGGLPDYPEQYDDGRSGNVTVACALESGGTPSQCRTTRLAGGRIFDVSVHSWLELKDVRFQTAPSHRRPPVRSVTLTVHFIGDGPPPE